MKRTSNPPRSSWSLRGPLAHICKLAMLAAVIATAQPSRPVTQADLEAVYLYNFGKFVTWPDQNAGSVPFVICTLGSEEFGGALAALTSNETLQGRKILIRHLPSVAEADGCHILFIGQSEEARLSKDLNAVRLKPILTVSSVPAFLEHGGMVQFVVQDKRVRFEVNLQSALQARLTISSELLKVALAVQGKPAEEAK